MLLTAFVVTGGDSDSPDEDTVKSNVWAEGTRAAARADSSDSTSSSSSSDDADRRCEPGGGDYRTLTPSRRLDGSTRRDDGFKWMPSEETVDIGEDSKLLENHHQDYSSASLDRRRRISGDRYDRDRKSRSSVSAKPPQHPSSLRPSPRPRKTRPDDNGPDLQRRWNSYEHFRYPDGSWWPMCWCHGPPPPPSCCMHERSWPSHPSLPPIPSRPSYKVCIEIILLYLIFCVSVYA